MGCDYGLVDCGELSEDLSAYIDGECSPAAAAVVEDHLDRCAPCRSFVSTSQQLRRRVRIAEAAPRPELSTEVVRRTVAEDRRSRPVLRLLLALVAVQILLLSIPDFVRNDGPDAHLLRHLGAFTVAYAAGLLVVVARPARARTMLSVSMVLAAAMVGVAAVDVVQGRVPLVRESLHLLEVLSVLFVWLLTRTPRMLSVDASSPTPHGTPLLRAVRSGPSE